ncbi:MAG: YigZ family protein [Oscillibacter sp.]|nr:YigZ family protein [Oscillibacter sp.]
MSAEEYYTPFQEAEAEFAEKRSRFIGHVWRTDDEEAARRRIEETRKRYHDARHNCWCYLIRKGNIVRYSDDGEPQGTAGQPMLNVFQRRGVTNACCVVTRYFGGVLLGAGGLARAYSRAAKDALDASGTALVSRRTLWEIPCPYALFEQVQREIRACGGQVESADYGERVTIRAAFPPGRADAFAERLRQLSAASVKMAFAGEAELPGERIP